MKRLTTDKEVIQEMMEHIPKQKNIFPSETKKISQRKLSWPEIRTTIEDRFEIMALDSQDIDKIEQTSRIYRLSFPELFNGVYEDLHFPTRYSNIMNQMKLLTLQDLQNGKIVSAWALSPSETNMSVEFSLTVTDPDYQGQGLCRKFTKHIDRWVEEAGAEQGVVYCAAFHKTTQKIFLDLGFEKQAILKGFILANAGNGRYARDNVVMYTKFYNNADKLCPPEIKILE